MYRGDLEHIVLHENIQYSTNDDQILSLLEIQQDEENSYTIEIEVEIIFYQLTRINWYITKINLINTNTNEIEELSVTPTQIKDLIIILNSKQDFIAEISNKSESLLMNFMYLNQQLVRRDDV